MKIGGGPVTCGVTVASSSINLITVYKAGARASSSDRQKSYVSSEHTDESGKDGLFCMLA